MFTGFGDDKPTITVEALATLILQAANSIEAAEQSSNREILRVHADHARSVLAAVDALKRSGKVDIMVEGQINSAILGLRQRLASFSEPIERGGEPL